MKNGERLDLGLRCSYFTKQMYKVRLRDLSFRSFIHGIKEHANDFLGNLR